jgi:hypothetical protein
VNRLLFLLAVALSFVSASFASSAGRLHTARFARLYEFINLCISRADIMKSKPVILLGLGPFKRVFCVRPTKNQKELANVIIYGKTRIGKGLNIVTNLLRWPFPVIVNDIKREIWDATA